MAENCEYGEVSLPGPLPSALVTAAAERLRVTIADVPPKEGGTAFVYQGNDRKGRTFAVRITHPGLPTDVRQRDFEGFTKARDLSADSHALLHVFDVCTMTVGDVWINAVKTEWCDSSLREFAEMGDVSRDSSFFDYFIGLARAVDWLKGRGYAHRDIKTGNILLLQKQVKLVDYGCLVPIKVDQVTEVPGPPMFTPAFAAPEVREGKVHERSDIFSLGIVYGELRSGLAADAVRAAIDRGTAPRGLTVGEWRLLQHALSQDPQQRPESAAAWAESLKDECLTTPLATPLRSLHSAKTTRLKIGILGNPATGKSTFLSMLCHPHCCEPSGDWVSFHDDKSHKSLHESYLSICENRATRATAVSSEETFHFTINSAKESWRVTTQDYAGELVYLKPSLGFELRAAGLVRRICQCDAIVAIFDATAANDQYMATWNMFIASLAAEARRNVYQLPVCAIVFTKVDQLCELTNSGIEQLASRLQKDAVFAAIQSQAQLFLRSRVFYVSSLGRVQPLAVPSNGNRFPPIDRPWTYRDLKPYKLLDPWVWSCRTAWDQVKQAMSQQAEQTKRKHSSLQGKSLRQSLKVLWSYCGDLVAFRRRFSRRAIQNYYESRQQKANLVTDLREHALGLWQDAGRSKYTGWALIYLMETARRTFRAVIGGLEILFIGMSNYVRRRIAERRLLARMNETRPPEKVTGEGEGNAA